MNDPSAGSPTETLLRLLFPLSAKICLIFSFDTIKKTHLNTQSVKATGGVYILQGRNQHELMTRAYQEFLVQDPQLQRSIPSTALTKKITQILSDQEKLVESAIVVRVQLRTSKGITDLLLPQTSM